MSKLFTLLATVVTTASLAALPLSATPVSAQSVTRGDVRQGAACRSLQVIGSKIAIRDFPFVNGLVVRSVPRGTILSTCEFVRGSGANSYPSKCGLRGADWYKVRSGRVSLIGSPFGYVPATCVRVL
ncbi:hypothetical protein HTZ77_19740 [Nonomuraea sp. SMC257]|uniref:SH3 domain-containing protein n=1 Tax=Nonomuraea montanisoli TaxID=2741721 RepID=A0A7Y6M4U9_9ACTN|nr:hypothetical protein [Nonomuraea montanisoli]NUW33649.1 hypothetical protein [Nonomuraea montanisoli]